MLIVAIPKSASTSLMVTLGRSHGIPSSQLFFQDAPVPRETRVLHRYHSDIREMEAEVVEGFGARDRIFKQHLPPTRENLRLLEGLRRVVLLREPQEVVEAYFRAQARGMHAPRPEFRGCRTPEAWQRRAEEVGLLDDLRWFHDGWEARAGSDPGEHLVIRFGDLTRDPTRVVNAVESFFGLPPTPGVVLSRERYSREPGPLRLARRLTRRLRGLLDGVVGRQEDGSR